MVQKIAEIISLDVQMSLPTSGRLQGGLGRKQGTMTNQRGQKMVALMWISLQQMTLEVTHSHLFQTAVRIFVFMYREENALSQGQYIRNVQTKLRARKSSFHHRTLLFRAGKRHSKQVR